MSEQVTQPTIETWGLADGRCPFRVYGAVYELDGRCPQTVRCAMAPSAPMRTEDGRGHAVIAVPVPIAEDYCQEECLTKMVRERERGMKVTERLPTIGGVLKGRGRPVRAPRADAKARREQRERLARQFLEDQRR